METLIINTEKANVKLILELVKKLGGSGKILSKEEQEDVLLGDLMTEGKTGEYVDIEEVLKKLSKKELAFYKKFGKAIAESKDAEAGKIKTKSLKEVLDEI